MTTGEIVAAVICSAWFALWFVIIIEANIYYWRMPKEWRRDIANDLYW